MEKSKEQKPTKTNNAIEKDNKFSQIDWECMFDSFEQPSMILDHDHNILFVNQATVNVTGKSKKQLVGKKCYESFHDSPVPIDKCPMESALSRSCTARNSAEIDIYNGCFLVSCYKFCPDNPDMPKILHVATDISEIKKNERKVQEQAGFQKLVSEITSQFASISPDETDEAINTCLGLIGKFAEVDRSYVFIFENDENYTVRNTHEWCASGVRPLMQELNNISFAENYPWFTRSLQKKKPVKISSLADIPAEGQKEKTRLKEAGIKSVLIIPMYSRKKLFGFLGMESLTAEKAWPEFYFDLLKIIGENIVQAYELKRHYSELIREKEILKTLMDNIPDNIYLKDSQSRFVLVNKAQAKALGLKNPEEAVGKSDADFFTYEFGQKTKRDENFLLTRNRPIIDLTEKITRPDGSTFWGSATKVPVMDKKGNSIGLIGITRNISKRIERQQKKSEINELCLYLLGEDSLEDKIQRVTETINDLFNATFTRVWLVRRGDICDRACRFGAKSDARDCPGHVSCLHLIASAGKYKRISGTHRRIPYGYNKVGKFLAEGRHSLITNNVQADDNIGNHEWAQKLGLRTFAAFRIKGPGSEPAGVLALFSKHGVDKEDEMLLSITVNTLAQAIQIEQSRLEILESERKYRLLFEQMTSGFALHEIICDHKGKPVDYRFLEVNPAFERMLGMKEGNIIGKTVKEVLPDVEPFWIETYGKVALKGESVSFEHFAEPLNAWYEVVAYSPEPGKFATVFEDITAQRQAREMLKKSEARFKALFDEAPIGYHELDKKGNITNVNKTEAEMLGYTKEEMIGQPVWKFAATPKAKERVQKKLKGQNLSKPGFETIYRKKNGRTIPVIIHDRLIKDENGKIIGIYSTIQDNTEWKKMQKRMAESELRFRSLVESATDAIVLADARGRVILWNNAATKIFGFTAEEMKGQSIEKLMPEDVRKVHDTYLKRIREGGEPRIAGKTVELKAHRKDGSEFPAEFSLSIWEVLRKKYFTAIIRDISERKTLEKQLRQSQKMEAIGTLAGGIAHDFNNILGAIMGYTELSLDDVAPDSITHSNLSKVLTASNRAKDLVKQILTYSRMEEHDIVPVRIQDAVTESLGLLRATIPASIKLNTLLEAKKATVLADPSQVHQILMNLTANASQAIGDKSGTITISVKEVEISPGSNGHPSFLSGRFVELKVADTGCGMSQNIIDRIFDPFFTTKEVGQGTGLGLSVIKGLVDKMNGHITVTSEVGKGTVFTILLPLLENNPLKETFEQKDIPGGNESILYVDDESDLVEIGRHKLESLGYAVTGMTDSKRALELFKSDVTQFDMVITDQAMPRLTGKELSEAILKIRPDIPIIMCTGYSDTVDEAVAKEIGIRRFFYKPVNAKDLARAVREVFEEQKTVVPAE